MFYYYRVKGRCWGWRLLINYDSTNSYILWKVTSLFCTSFLHLQVGHELAVINMYTYNGIQHTELSAVPYPLPLLSSLSTTVLPTLPSWSSLSVHHPQWHFVDGHLIAFLCLKSWVASHSTEIKIRLHNMPSRLLTSSPSCLCPQISLVPLLPSLNCISHPSLPPALQRGSDSRLLGVELNKTKKKYAKLYFI